LARFQTARGIAPAAGFFGPITRSFIGAMAVTVPGVPTAPVVPAGLTVALATDTPVATSLVTSDLLGSQALAPMVKLTFSNGNPTEARITTLRLTRTGIAADADLANVYLYDGDTRLAEMTSVVNRVYSFVNAAGLFSVPANSTRSILVRADLVNDDLSGKTISLGINAATDIIAGDLTFAGAFPLRGNMMSTAVVNDIGRLEVSATVTAPASVDPGITGREIFRFNMVAANQNLNVSRIKFTNVGTIANTDLANLKLMDGTTQLGRTLTNLATDNTAVFDLSTAPLAIASGATKNLTVVADVVGGTARNFRLTIQRQSDIVVQDTSYGIYIRPYTHATNNTFSVIQPANVTTVNTGALVVTIDTASPTGNVALNSTNIELARFRFVASGESVRVLSLPVQLNLVAATNLRNVRLMLDGSQVGATVASIATATATTFPATGDFGNSFIIPAGTTGRVLSIRADIASAAGAGDALANGDTITAQLNAGSANAQGMTSMTSLSTGATTGRLLTVATGALTVARNLTVPNGSSGSPTAVLGATGARIGSFVLTAGAGEAVSVSQIQLTDDVGTGIDTHTLADVFQNLRLMMGTTQVGTTITSLTDTDSVVYTFTPATAISIPAGQQVVFDVLADVRSTATTTTVNADTTGIIHHTLTTAIGAITSATANATASVPLQNVFIASAGTLTVVVAPDSPVSQQVVMGDAGVALAQFRFTETSMGEAVNISRIVVRNTTTSGTGGTLSNIQLLDGTTLLSTVATLAEASSTTFDATFSGLDITIPRGGNKTLTVRADITPHPGATAASTHILNVVSFVATGASSGASVTSASSSGTAGTMTAYATKISVVRDALSPSGLSARTVDLASAIFRVSNSANVGNFDAILQDLAINVSTSGSWTTGTTRNIRVYRNSISSANLLATRAFAPTFALGNVATGGWTTPANLIDVPISSGGSVTLIVTVDTNEAPTTGGTLTISIPAGGIIWTAGPTANINVVDTLPVSGSTLSF